MINCHLTDEDVVPIVKIDLPLSLNYLDEGLIKVVEELRPFGKGNPSPLFAVKDLRVERIWLLGKEKNFLKLRFSFYSNERKLYIDGVTFDKLEDFRESFINIYGEDKYLEATETSFLNVKVDVIYYPSINEFKGNRTCK